ncbi:hypothetical protein BDV18DRAFT_143300 [Aspergillus unguis]
MSSMIGSYTPKTRRYILLLFSIFSHNIQFLLASVEKGSAPATAASTNKLKTRFLELVLRENSDSFTPQNRA